MKRVLHFFAPLLHHYQFLLIACVPSLLVTAWGLYQVEVTSAVAWLVTLLARFCVEYAFLGFCLSILNAFHIKNKWLLGILLFFYYISTTADFVLLLYFKERFGAKYFATLQGGDYAFMTDWRLLSYFLVLGGFCMFLTKKCFTPRPTLDALKQTGLCALILCFFTFINPFTALKNPHDFFARYFLPPSPVYLINALLAHVPSAKLVSQLPTDTAQTALQYHVFSAKNTGIGKDYSRVILIATESLSAKYMHRFNNHIPPAAGRGYDQLFDAYPATTVQTVTLSTLYGLTVLFSSHPYVELSYQNNYPLSFVKELQKNGFHTAFIRGAHEDYMDENKLFHQAGFDVVQGWNFFQTQPAYQKYLHWWGLLDRKLYDYAVDYLDQHRHEKTFLTLLTVDTHVPLGRTDYLNESYEEIDAQYYDKPTLPRAFARAAQDVEHFLQQLRAKNLLDEHTLIVFTADHPSFSNIITPDLFTPFEPVFDRIPLAIITASPLKQPLTTHLLASQLDIAPTLLDLLNLPQPKGFFGHSLFDQHTPRTIFEVKEDYVIVSTNQDKQVISLHSTRPQDKKILDLLQTIWLSQ